MEYEEFERRRAAWGDPPWWAAGQRWFQLDEASRAERLGYRRIGRILASIVLRGEREAR